MLLDKDDYQLSEQHMQSELFPELVLPQAYSFPKPQYLGAKYILKDWIASFFPANAKKALDGFGGTQSISFMMKQQGLQTITNDLLAFNHKIGLSLIENKNNQLSQTELNMLFEIDDKPSDWILIEQNFSGLFFDEATAKLLDRVRWNIENLSNPYKKALALTIINRAMMRKTTMGHFAHTRALVYAADPERLKRNRSLARPIQELALELLPEYNAAIFDNRQENQSFCGDILDLLPQISNIDFAYFDPPYCDSHSDYQSFYHLPETYTEYWRDKQFINKTKRYDPPRYSGFDKKRDILSSFEELFRRSENIPVWLISYNDRSYPKAEDLARMIAKYKDVTIEAKEYREGRGGKGSVAGSREILFVCKPKTQVSVAIAWSKEMASFNHWKKAFDADEMDAFNFNDSGILWLKIKSIARKDLIANFISQENIVLSTTKIADEFVELYEQLSLSLSESHQKIDRFIRATHHEHVSTLNEQALVTELYKLRFFDWGGDYKNALDRYLVDRFIKVYISYDELTAKFDGEISRAVQGYVLCSWYNHWSSILIEHLFKKHPIVLPTVGQIKKVDFFVNGIPFDLKVTYLPANFIEKKRKEFGLKPELTELKQAAKSLGIVFNKDARHDDIYYEITQKLKDKGTKECLDALEAIKKVRLDILSRVQKDPKSLIQNLYEEQGEMRFDASNRLFLVLVDSSDFDNSWKLKRNMDALNPAITAYLDNFKSKKMDDLRISFRYKAKAQEFKVLSDIIFVVR
jgi:adenine-specific DNA methylase